MQNPGGPDALSDNKGLEVDVGYISRFGGRASAGLKMLILLQFSLWRCRLASLLIAMEEGSLWR